MRMRIAHPRFSAAPARRANSPRGSRRGPGSRVTAVARRPHPRARCRRPARLRVGGFGGADGLARMAPRASASTCWSTRPIPSPGASRPTPPQAAAAAGVPLVVLCRPPWTPLPGDRWTRVADMAAAVAALGARAAPRLSRHRPAGGRGASAPRRSTATSCAASSRSAPADCPAGRRDTSSPAARSPRPTSARC